MTDQERPDLDAMSRQELRAWSAEQYRRSREAFRGQPVPEISRAKRDDYPHWELVGWALKVGAGRPVHVRFGGVEAERVEGRTVGLRPVADGGGPALVVDLGRRGRWAVRRADGEVWTDDLSVSAVKTAELNVAVVAWTLSGEPPMPGQAVAEPGRVDRAWVRTARLEQDK